MTPIPKGRDSTNVGNNRPILVLPIFNKKIEEVVYKQSTLIENKIIHFISINMVSESISLLYEALLIIIIIIIIINAQSKVPTKHQREQTCLSVRLDFSELFIT